MSTAKLVLDGKEHELPVVVGSEGEVGIDISKLRDKSGAITLDDGYGNTGSCKSAITFIDGDKGILRYIVGNMHPVIRAGIEQAFGRDLYSDKPFTDSPRELFGISMPPTAVRFAQQLRFVNEINRLNLLNLNEFKVMIDAVDRQSAEAQSSFGSKLASSAFSPLPKPRAKVVDVGKEGRYRQALDDQQLRSAKSRIIRAAVGKAGPTTEDEIALAQEQFAEAAARTRRRDRISNQYKDPNAEPTRPPSDPLERFLLGR